MHALVKTAYHYLTNPGMTPGSKHHCRLLRVSAQVERSMGVGSAAPCFAEARWEVSGAVLHQNRDA